MRFPEMTPTRWWIVVAIAVVAPVAFVLGLYSRRERFEKLASYHYLQMNCIYTSVPAPEEDTEFFETVPLDRNFRPVSAQRQRSDNWHLQLALKYEQAAQQPWLLVEPDPPSPEWPVKPVAIRVRVRED